MTPVKYIFPRTLRKRSLFHEAFTLVEVMIAAAILAIMSASTLVAFNAIHRNAVDNRTYSNACAILHGAIETALAARWTDPAAPLGILLETGTDGIQFDPYSGTDTPSPTQIFPAPTLTEGSYWAGDPIVTGTVTRIVTRKSADVTDPNYGLLQVTMRIQYTIRLDRTSRGHTITLEMRTVRADDT